MELSPSGGTIAEDENECKDFKKTPNVPNITHRVVGCQDGRQLFLWINVGKLGALRSEIKIKNKINLHDFMHYLFVVHVIDCKKD